MFPFQFKFSIFSKKYSVCRVLWTEKLDLFHQRNVGCCALFCSGLNNQTPFQRKKKKKKIQSPACAKHCAMFQPIDATSWHLQEPSHQIHMAAGPWHRALQATWVSFN